jgi:microcin C transport system permease protein
LIRLNPITRRRLSRFRASKRAWFSFWLLLALYTLSLFSEFIANDKPLWVRFEGQWFVPVLFYYPEDTFLKNGVKTRPDYKAISKTAVFSNNADNTMAFPPIPFGPFESIDPAAIEVSDRVRAVFRETPAVGSAAVSESGEIVRSVGLAPFFAGSVENLRGRQLADLADFPPSIQNAVKARFQNEASGAVSETVTTISGKQAEVSLRAHVPRSHPPRLVRLTFRETVEIGEAETVLSFSSPAEPEPPVPELWTRLPEPARKQLLAAVQRRFQERVDPFLIVAGDQRYTVSLEKQEVTFPYPPTQGHPMGIDAAGRDVSVRILYGLRISLTFALLLVIFSTLLGIAAGAGQGYAGGRIDIFGQRLIEIWSALPFLYIMILMGAVYGRSFVLLLFCYGIFNWIGISYYVRAEFLRLRRQPFVEAARCMGVSTGKIIFRHILPNALVPVITFFPFYLVGAIGALAALDYLGFGLPPPTPSWGELLHQAQQHRWKWWLMLYPSLALFFVMLFGVFVGEGVRNAYDPKQFTRLE